MNWERLWYGPRTTLDWVLFVLLAPLSLLYGLGSRCFHALYDFGLRQPVRIDGAKVISVGNLVAGGAGKTPVTIWLARKASAAGLQVAVLSRGYGRHVQTLMHFNSTALPDVGLVGDEPRMIARSCPGVEVWVGADRVESARAAVAHGAKLLILDDGYQHRRLHRDLNLLVDAGSGNGWPLPAGPLREFGGARVRAHLVWGRDGVKGDITAHHRVRRVRLPDGNQTDASTLAGRSVVVLTAIARPARLLRSLEALDARITAVHAFPDHHLFTAAELAPIVAQAEQSMSIIVTTEKDLERLTLPVHALVQDLELEDGAQLPKMLADAFTR